MFYTGSWSVAAVPQLKQGCGIASREHMTGNVIWKWSLMNVLHLGKIKEPELCDASLGPLHAALILWKNAFPRLPLS